MFETEIGTCLQSGSNLLFLIDGSDSINNEKFLQTKSMLKKLVESLKIEGIEKYEHLFDTLFK